MIENNLQQNTFLTMGLLFQAARQHLDQQFKPYNLSRNEWLILALLRVSDNALSQSFAKSYLGLETSYFTKVLNSLEKKNLIIREIDPDDRRNRVIKANPKSSLKIKKIYQIIFDQTKTIQSDLSEKQLVDLHKSLASIGERLKTLQS